MAERLGYSTSGVGLGPGCGICVPERDTFNHSFFVLWNERTANGSMCYVMLV